MGGVGKVVPTDLLAAILAAIAVLMSYNGQTTDTGPQTTSMAQQPITSGSPSVPVPSEIAPHPRPQQQAPAAQPANPAPSPSQTPDADHISNDPRVTDVTALTNSERQKAGCSPVKLNAQLDQAAVAHSTDMAQRDFFDHNSPEGTTPGSRVRKAGYNWHSTGENIAYGYKTPQEVMNVWMNSEGHRKNILDCEWIDIGVGIAANTDGTLYWTQEFAKP